MEVLSSVEWESRDEEASKELVFITATIEASKELSSKAIWKVTRRSEIVLKEYFQLLKGCESYFFL